MPRLITKPAVIEAAGNKPKRIEEFAGRLRNRNRGRERREDGEPAGLAGAFTNAGVR